MPRREKIFMNLRNAAEVAGFSERHFRRIIEEERFRVIQVGGKLFILAAEFNRWQAANARRTTCSITNRGG